MAFFGCDVQRGTPVVGRCFVGVCVAVKQQLCDVHVAVLGCHKQRGRSIVTRFCSPSYEPWRVIVDPCCVGVCIAFEQQLCDVQVAVFGGDVQRSNAFIVFCCIGVRAVFQKQPHHVWVAQGSHQGSVAVLGLLVQQVPNQRTDIGLQS